MVSGYYIELEITNISDREIPPLLIDAFLYAPDGDILLMRTFADEGIAPNESKIIYLDAAGYSFWVRRASDSGEDIAFNVNLYLDESYYFQGPLPRNKPPAAENGIDLVLVPSQGGPDLTNLNPRDVNTWAAGIPSVAYETIPVVSRSQGDQLTVYFYFENTAPIKTQKGMTFGDPSGDLMKDLEGIGVLPITELHTVDFTPR